jgi:hypothetical protein
MDAMRGADRTLLTTDAIAGRIIEAKGFDTADAALRKAIGEQALAILRSFRKRGTVRQIGTWARSTLEARRKNLA